MLRIALTRVSRFCDEENNSDAGGKRAVLLNQDLDHGDDYELAKLTSSMTPVKAREQMN